MTVQGTPRDALHSAYPAASAVVACRHPTLAADRSPGSRRQRIRVLDGLRITRRGAEQTSRFLLVGVLTLCVDVTVLTMLERGFGLPLVVATTAGSSAALLFNFYGQRLAFGSTAAGLQSTWRYATLVVANWLVTLALVTSADAVGVGWPSGKAAAVALLTCLNFFAYRRWVFPSHRQAAGSP